MEKWKKGFESLSETITITKLDGSLLLAICALAGIIIGMLISPRKNAHYGCNNGSTEINNFGNDSEDEMWDADDEDDEFYEDDEPLSFT